MVHTKLIFCFYKYTNIAPPPSLPACLPVYGVMLV